jgi:hypothetical protein
MFKVQRRQFRKWHEDGHYCNALLKYLREYAILHRRYATFISVDDKCKISFGPPGFPLASVERGRRCLVGTTESNEAGDHDFGSMSMTPSVLLDVDIPESDECSFYSGKATCFVKDSIFEPSTPIRHACEMLLYLEELYGSVAAVLPILLLYSDGGADHRNNSPSVIFSLALIFLRCDLDVLIASRNAPGHSYRNMAERVMAILNLALQAVALERLPLPEGL